MPVTVYVVVVVVLGVTTRTIPQGGIDNNTSPEVVVP